MFGSEVSHPTGYARFLPTFVLLLWGHGHLAYCECRRCVTVRERHASRGPSAR